MATNTIRIHRVLRAETKVLRAEWSDWGERHGRHSREVAVERNGSCRDTGGYFLIHTFSPRARGAEMSILRVNFTS